MTITAEELAKLSDALRSGQQCDEDGVMCIVSRQACHEAAYQIERIRTGTLVHVDEVESKMTLPDCPEVLWAQRHLGRDDWQVSENVTPASMGVSASEKFVNARELREAVGEVEKLREALAWYGEQARLCRLIHSQGDLGRHALQNDGGTIARAALGDSQ